MRVKLFIILIIISKKKVLKPENYMYISDIYNSPLQFYCHRFSNNANPIFTDQELLTVYLFCGVYQRYFKIKEIHTFTQENLLSWFPNLPSYQTFNYRLNLMNEALSELAKHLITFFKPVDCNFMTSLIDSIPIIICAGKNKIGKVTTDIATNGYCFTKNMYYFGFKLHMLTFRLKGIILFHEKIILSSAEENDLTVLKREAPVITHREKATRDLFSTAVSKVRQPIEPFFKRLNEKTNIQTVMKVRSTSGLLVHTMGKMTIALIYLIF